MKKTKKILLCSSFTVVAATSIVTATCLPIVNHFKNENIKRLEKRYYEQKATEYLTYSKEEIDNFQGLPKNEYYTSKSAHKDSRNWEPDRVVHNRIEGTPESFSETCDETAETSVYLPTESYLKRTEVNLEPKIVIAWYETISHSHDNVQFVYLEDNDKLDWPLTIVSPTYNSKQYKITTNKMDKTDWLHDSFDTIDKGWNEKDDGVISISYKYYMAWNWTDSILKVSPSYHMYSSRKDRTGGWKYKVTFDDNISLKSTVYYANLEKILDTIVSLLQSVSINVADNQYNNLEIAERTRLVQEIYDKVIDASFKQKMFDLYMELPSNFKATVSYDEAENKFKVSIPFWNNAEKSFYLTNAALTSNRPTTIREEVRKNGISAIAPLTEYNSDELSYFINEKNQSDKFFPMIKNFILTRKEDIFEKIYKEPDIDILEATSIENSGKLTVRFRMNNALLDNEVYGSKEFTINITDFKMNNLDTTPKIVSINYETQQFKDIFGSDADTFAVDWLIPENNEKYKKLLLDYMNTHLNLFLNNIVYHGDDFTVSNVNGLDFVIDRKQGVVNVSYTFVGFKNGQFDRSIPGSAIIILKGDNSLDDNSNLLNGFQDYLQKWVDDNGIFPKIPNQLQEVAANFLNQEDVKSKLPTSTIPASGTFEPENISILNSIDTSLNPITINSGVIVTNSFPSLSFPLVTINFQDSTTVAPSCNATSPISDFLASEYTYIFSKYGNSNGLIKRLKKWIIDNKSIFKNFTPNDDNLVINQIATVPNIDNAIRVDLKLTNAMTANGPSDIFPSLVINGLVSRKDDTKLKITELKYNDPLFKDIFKDDKSFFADWTSNEFTLEKKERILNDYINAKPSVFFIDSITDINDIVKDISLEVDNENQNTLVAVIEHKGVKNNTFVDDIVSKLKIILKQTPGFYESINEDPLWSKFEAFINNQISQNSIVIQKPETLKILIADYLNANLNNIPNVCIPGGKEGQFLPGNININIAINFDKQVISIKDGDISIDGGELSLSVPSFEFENKQANLENQKNQQTLVYVIIGSVSAGVLLLILLFILMTIRKKKSKEINLDDYLI